MRLPTKRASVILVSLTFSLPASAELVQHVISVPVTLERDSNPRMVANGAESVIRERIAPQYTLRQEFSASALDLSVGALIEQSSNQALSANRKDPNLGFLWKRTNPTSQFSLKGRYEQTSARTSEFQETGLVTVDKTRTTKSLGGGWINALSERTNLTFNGDYKDVTHESGGTGLIDFSTTGLSASLGYALSERDEIFASTSINRYVPATNTTPTSRNYNLMLGYRSKVSDLFDFTAQTGAVLIDAATSSTSWQGNLKGSYTGDRFNTALDVGRMAAPSGVTGGFTNSDQLKWQLGYALSERAKAGVDLSWIKTQGGAQNAGQSTAQTYGASFSYELSAFWALALRGQNKQIDRATGNATGNVLGLTLTYFHPDF